MLCLVGLSLFIYLKGTGSLVGLKSICNATLWLKKKVEECTWGRMCVLVSSVHWCSCEYSMLCKKCVKLRFVVSDSLREELCLLSVDLRGSAVRLLLARNLKYHFPCRTFLHLLRVQAILTVFPHHTWMDFRANTPSCFKENPCFPFLLWNPF